MEQACQSEACDREVFERVWRRVMPEDRPDCPFVLPEPPQPPAPAQPPALPALAAPAPAGGTAEEGAGLGARLQELLDGALAAWRRYQVLSRRSPGEAGRALSALAADEHRHAKRLSAAYFLLTGVRYWPAVGPAEHGRTPLAPALREGFWAERRAAAGFRAVEAQAEDRFLRELCQELAAAEEEHARRLQGLLERL